MSKTDKEYVFEMQSEAVDLFNDSSNVEVRAYAHGVIICINALIKKGIIKND